MTRISTQDLRCFITSPCRPMTRPFPTPSAPESAPKPLSSTRPPSAASHLQALGGLRALRLHPRQPSQAECSPLPRAVKCTDSLRAGAYETRATYTTGKSRAVYTKRDIDFIAAHVIELNIWYIIPVQVCSPAPMLRFYPHRKAKLMRLEKYREAWHLLDPPLTIHACLDPDYPEKLSQDSESEVL